MPAGSNLVDEVWAADKPPMPQEKVWHLTDQNSGQSTLSKYKDVAGKLQEGCNILMVTALDDIAWLLNLRGNDIEYNPLFFSYLLFHRDGDNHRVDLFINEDKVSEPQMAEYLKSINVSVYGYDAIEGKLEEYSKLDSKKVSIDKSDCNYRKFSKLNELGFEVVDQKNLIPLLKCQKNEVQQEGMRQCNIRDCAAIMKYFAFLEEELKKPGHGLNEFNGARKVEEYRTFGDLYKGPSFDTISSIGANGAVIHYKPNLDDAKALNNDEIYLLDSGGQYLDGTTDITRTAHFGGKEPTAFQREAYTRVLLGVLDLEKVVWPAKSRYAGKDFDILARKHLFEAGLDFKHGTGP